MGIVLWIYPWGFLKPLEIPLGMPLDLHLYYNLFVIWEIVPVLVLQFH